MAKKPSQGRNSNSKASDSVENTAKTPDLDAIEDAVEIPQSSSDVTLENGESSSDVAESLAREIRESAVATDPQLTVSGDPTPEEPSLDPVDASDKPPSEPETAEERPSEKQPSEPEPAERPAPAPVAAPQRPSVFLPMLLGGLLAGGIGYFVAYGQYAGQEDPTIPLSARIDELSAQLDALPPPADLSGVEAAIAGVQDAVAANQDAIAPIPDQIQALADRIGVLERQPSGDGTLQETALAAFEQDISGLRAQLDEQRAQMQAMVDEAASQLSATREEALSIEQNAVDAARAATARAALARVEAAMASGAPIGPVLAELGDTLDAPLPDGLTAVADGTPTLSELRESFPEAARAALSTARAAGVDGEGGGGLGGFIRSQLDVRSVTPQEGDSVDAILSRAEAALNDGRLADVLAEVAALPDEARDPLAEWTASATLRANAVEAVDTLADSLNR